MARDRDDERKKARRASARTWAETADTGSGSRDKSVALPDGVEEFRPTKPGTYTLDLVPYIASERSDAYVDDARSDADPGGIAFRRPYLVHKGVGAKNQTRTCNSETFGKKCPICHYRSKHPPEDYKNDPLRAKTRLLWRVRVTAGPDKDLVDSKKIRVWNTAHYKGFGERLKEEFKEEIRKGADAVEIENYKVEVRMAEAVFNGNKYLDPAKVTLIPRDKPLPERLFEEDPCLDDLVVEEDYTKLKEVFEQGAEDEEVGTAQEQFERAEVRAEAHGRPASSRNGASRAVEEAVEEEDDDEDEEEDDDPPPSARGARKSTVAVPKPVAVDDDEDEDEVEIDEEDDEEEDSDVDPDELDEDDDEDEPPPAAKKPPQRKAPGNRGPR